MHLVDTTVFYSPTSGGVKRYLTAKHDWLRAHTPFEHTLLVPGAEHRLVRGGTSTVRGLRIPGSFNYRLPLNPRRWSAQLAALEPDLIEVGDAFHPAWCAAQVAERRGIPLVAFFHSNLPQILGRRFGRSIESALARYVRRVYQRFDLVLAPSHSMVEYLYGIGVAQARLQPLGVDADVFHPARRKHDLRARLGLPADARLLVYAGRFSGEKNIHVLHEAFRRLGPRYQLLMIGGGEHAAPADNIRVLPYRRDSAELAEWLASCDALVHAGSRETFGLVIVEAMACGLPVVGTAAGAVRELVDDTVGALARPNDAASMAESIDALYQRNLALLGQAARLRVMQRHTWSRSLQMLLTSYASVGVRAPAPRSEATTLVEAA